MDLRVPPRDEIIRHEIGGVLISGNVRPKWRFSIRAKLLDSSNRKSGAGLFCSLAMSNHSCQLRTRGVRASRTSLFIRLNISGGMKVVLAKSRYGSILVFIILAISFALSRRETAYDSISTPMMGTLKVHSPRIRVTSVSDTLNLLLRFHFGPEPVSRVSTSFISESSDKSDNSASRSGSTPSSFSVWSPSSESEDSPLSSSFSSGPSVSVSLLINGPSTEVG
jgi:hypothetical protein